MNVGVGVGVERNLDYDDGVCVDVGVDFGYDDGVFVDVGAKGNLKIPTQCIHPSIFSNIENAYINPLGFAS